MRILVRDNFEGIFHSHVLLPHTRARHLRAKLLSRMTESSDGEMISRRQRKTWMNPYDPVSPLGQLAEAKR